MKNVMDQEDYKEFKALTYITIGIIGLFLPILVGLILFGIAAIEYTLSSFDILLNISWELNWIVNLYIIVFSISFWLSSFYLNAISIIAQNYSDIKSTYADSIFIKLKRKTFHLFKIITFVIIPIIIFLCTFFYHSTNSMIYFISFYIYFSYLILSVNNIRNTIHFFSYRIEFIIIGSYSIIGVTILWLIPTLHPFFLITNLVVTSEIVINGLFNY